MRTAGAIALVVFALAGLAWFVLELGPQFWGFADTDSPAVSLDYLRGHADIYAWAGVVLLAMAVSLVVGTIATADVLGERAGSLAVRSTSAFGLFAAAFFFLNGVIRLGVRPLLYIDSLDPDWGEAAYLVVQMTSIHGAAQAAITALCLWAIGVSVFGYRGRTVPTIVCVLGAIPLIRLLGVLGPLGIADALPGETWLLFMASIPGVYVWCLALGVALARRRAATADG